jgi:hypothetical protein
VNKMLSAGHTSLSFLPVKVPLIGLAGGAASAKLRRCRRTGEAVREARRVDACVGVRKSCVRSMVVAIGLAIDALAVISLMGPTGRRWRGAEGEADLHRKQPRPKSVNLHQSQRTWTPSDPAR